MLLVKYGLILLIFKLFPLCCNGDRIKHRMYIDINASTSCFRRLNATHQVGCSSKRAGATGVAHFCEVENDLTFILKNGNAGPYIPILPVSLWSKKILQTLEKSSKVSGLLLYMNNETLVSFSHDLQCPNENYGVENTCSKTDDLKWNSGGTGILFENIRFPVFYIDKHDDIKTVRDCFNKFNNYSYDTQRDRSLCSVQLNSFMFGAKNTPTCIRRSNIATNLNPVRVCDPLGDKNVWASLFPLATYDEKTDKIKPILGQKYIVVAARTDTASFFDRTSGADSPITGLVTLLAVAKLLKQMLPKNENYNTNVLFILFNGETFDYIGSQRVLYDMQNGNFPIETQNGTAEIFPVIKPSDISLFIELSQLSRGDGRVFAHLYKVDSKNTNFTERLRTNMAASISLQKSEGTLPPSSVQTFLKKYENLSTIILTNHLRAFSNKFYNSIFDNSTNINYEYLNIGPSSIQQHLSDVANTISKSIFEEITGQTYTAQNQKVSELVDELLHCYLENPNCKIFQAVGKQPQQQQNRPFNLYVGVDGNTNKATTLLGFVLGWFVGDIVGESNENCTNISKNYAFRFYNMSVSMNDLNNTMCFRMVMNFTEAVSPAFIIKDYDWSSNLYSSWSESTWGEINMRLFLKPSTSHESMTMAVGCLSLLFSSILVYFIKSRSHILFTPESIQPSPVDC
ncbi:hypothetical protein WA026_002586 [Henosepilachna vigintioctopunctata]|uniref:Nicastrin n=1 Tax=Henosepilachna vigintioctopunctata TaxID=420089 RepID=A0AAW1TTW7_9CUCU